MDVLACPSCARRFAVGRAGSLGGWRCAGCSNELRVVNRDVLRSSPRNVPPRATPTDNYLQQLGPLGRVEHEQLHREVGRRGSAFA
jgi:tRNA(Ile2) C34 agmatinyltransferase TiaS